MKNNRIILIILTICVISFLPNIISHNVRAEDMVTAGSDKVAKVGGEQLSDLQTAINKAASSNSAEAGTVKLLKNVKTVSAIDVNYLQTGKNN